MIPFLHQRQESHSEMYRRMDLLDRSRFGGGPVSKQATRSWTGGFVNVKGCTPVVGSEQRENEPNGLTWLGMHKLTVAWARNHAGWPGV